MQKAAVVLGVLRERGGRGLPCTQLYRQLFNKDLYLLAYGNIYSNQGAMTPGTSAETADGMSEGKIDQIIELIRQEKYRFAPARRISPVTCSILSSDMPSAVSSLAPASSPPGWSRCSRRPAGTVPC